MKTETELKKTWCPFARGLVVVDKGGVPITAAGVNIAEQTGVGGVMSLCLGFACSQCVDYGPKMETEEHLAGTKKEIAHREANGWTYVPAFGGGPRHWRRETGERYAYCGQNVGEALQNELPGMVNAIVYEIKQN